MGLIQKLTVPTLVALWAFTYFLEISKNVTQDQMLIRPVFYLLIFLYVINTVGDIRSWRREEQQDKAPVQPKLLIFIALVIACLALFSLLGFIITCFLFLLASFWLFHVRSKAYLLGLPLIITALLFIIFKIMLGVALPDGVLAF